MPIAAPAARRRRFCSNGSSMPRPRTPAWTAWKSAATNFIPRDAFPYQTPVALQYDSGDYFATLDAALKHADWAGFEIAPGRREGSGENCAASAFPPISKPAASRLRKWWARSAPAPGSTKSPTCACIRPAASPCSPARTATARDTKPLSPSSSPTSSACRSPMSMSCMGTRQRSRSGWAPTAAVASRSAARRWSRRWTRSSRREKRSRRI